MRRTPTLSTYNVLYAWLDRVERAAKRESVPCSVLPVLVLLLVTWGKSILNAKEYGGIQNGVRCREEYQAEAQASTLGDDDGVGDADACGEGL